MDCNVSPDTKFLFEHGWRFDFDTDRWFPPAHVLRMVPVHVLRMVLTPDQKQHGFAHDNAIDFEKHLQQLIGERKD